MQRQRRPLSLHPRPFAGTENIAVQHPADPPQTDGLARR